MSDKTLSWSSRPGTSGNESIRFLDRSRISSEAIPVSYIQLAHIDSDSGGKSYSMRESSEGVPFKIEISQSTQFGKRIDNSTISQSVV